MHKHSLEEASSLPHRQLRNGNDPGGVPLMSSLPHRQLRKAGNANVKRLKSSLPHRQLRNRYCRRYGTTAQFAAAQAA